MLKKRLLDLVREQIRFKHYSIKTERTYISWIKRFIFFHQKKHPIDMGKEEIGRVISNLTGVYQLIGYLMYGCGLRMKEVLNLRIKDIDFSFDKIHIFDSKSLKDRKGAVHQL